MSFKNIHYLGTFTEYGVSDLFGEEDNFAEDSSKASRKLSELYSEEPLTDDFDTASRKLIEEEKGLSTISSLSSAKRQKTENNPRPDTPMKMPSKIHFSQAKQTQENIPYSEEGDPVFNRYIPVENLQFTHKYQLDGKDHSLLKQRNYRGSGPVALLMLWSDLIRSDSSRTILGESFWDWVENCAQITSPKNMIKRAKISLNLQLRNQDFERLKAKNVQEPISEINDKPQAKFLAINWFIKESGHSILAYIQEQKWIVIDQVDLEKKILTMRDPSQGKPLQVSFEEASPWFDECASNCLWVEETNQM